MKIDSLNIDQTAYHVEMIHDLAKNCGCGGVLVLASYGKDPISDKNISPKVNHFDIGSFGPIVTKIEKWAKDKHRNIYMPLATFVDKPDVPLGLSSKGSEKNIEKTFGLVCDFDDEDSADYATRLPLPPDVILETSPGNFQTFYLFDKGLNFSEAKPIAQKLHKYTKCCHASVDLCHVWRVPGLLNWPTKSKISSGRSPDPVLVRVVKSWNGSLTCVPDLKKALKSVISKPKSIPLQNEEIKKIADSIIIDPRSEIPKNKFNSLFEIFPLFQATWDEKRTDLKDESASGYDQSSANFGAQLDFSDQEIVDLLVSRRRHHGHDLHQKNKQYYARTILTARSANQKIPDGALPSSKNDAVDTLNKTCAALITGNKFCVLQEFYDPDKKRTDIRLLSKSDFIAWNQNSFTSNPLHKIDGRNRKIISVGERWMNSEKRRQYEGLIFSPGKDVPGFYNLYRGLAVEPKSGDWSILRNHIHEIICGGDDSLFRWVIAWFARIVQDPGGERPGTAIVLRGGQGCGKGALLSTFGRLLVPHFLHIRHVNHIAGRFNDHLKDCIFSFVDEGFVVSDKKSIGVLRGLITEKYNLIEPKGKNSFQLRSHINVAMASNQFWVVPAGMDERRFCVLDVSPKKAGDRSYFQGLFDQIKNGGLAAFLHDLLEFDRAGIDLRTIPTTEALWDQKQASMTPLQKFWLTTLMDGSLPVKSLRNKFSVSESDGFGLWSLSNEIDLDTLFEIYSFFADTFRDDPKIIKPQFSKELKLLCDGLSSVRRNIGDGKVTVLIFPTLEQCRKSFELKVKREIEWDRSDPDSARFIESNTLIHPELVQSKFRNLSEVSSLH